VGNISQTEEQPSSRKKAGGSQSRGAKSREPPLTPTSATQSSPLARPSSKKTAEKTSEQSGVEDLSLMDELSTIRNLCFFGCSAENIACFLEDMIRLREH